MAGEVKTAESSVSKLRRELGRDRPRVTRIRSQLRTLDRLDPTVRLNRAEAGVRRRARNFLNRRGGRRG